MLAVSCPRVAPADGLDRTAVSISVSSTTVSALLVNRTNCSVSPGWKVTTRLVIAAKSANSEMQNRENVVQNRENVVFKVQASMCLYLLQLEVASEFMITRV